MNTDLSTLTGAYAVNALTGAERKQFERHLATCEDCAREVDELRSTAARLGADATAAPPEALKQRVLDEISRTRQLPPRTQQAPMSSVLSLRKRLWSTRLAVAAAVIGIALAGALGGVAWQSQHQLADLTERVEQADDRNANMIRVLQAPDAHLLRTSADGAQATTVVSRQRGQAVFVGSNMPALPRDHVHQLWFIQETGPTSAGLLTPGEGNRTSSEVATMPTDTSQMAVTVEPAGGSPQPTTSPILVINVPA